MLRQATVYGVRPKRLFREAALKFVAENGHKSGLRTDIYTLKQLDPYIGELSLESIHMGSLQSFIQARRKEEVKARTINYGLQLVRHILNLAASEWIDEYGLTWLAAAPKIKLLPEPDKRKPYPLSWEEQTRLFQELPPHLRRMALFAVNTGCREAEICNLRWDWEIKLPKLNCSVFIIPDVKVKSRQDRLVIVNRIVQSLLEELRGQHARIRAGLPQVRVHDLKHNFGRRLRAAGVSFEDRQDLLGHKSTRITTHCSAAELTSLIEAAIKSVWGTVSHY